MKVTIDASGRLVLPKAARNALRIEGPTELDLRIVGNHIELQTAPADVSLVQKEGILVAVPRDEPPEPLTADTVEETRRAVLDERGSI